MTTTVAPKIVGEPVTDLRFLAESSGAIDRSYVSVDEDGLYAVVVTERFGFFTYTSEGWRDVTSEVEGLSAEGVSQSIDDLPVDKAHTVTTRDYDGDRESEFLLRFDSGAASYGAIFTPDDGRIGITTFCLLNPPAERPGILKVGAVEDLAFDDRYGVLEGNDIYENSEPTRSYWRWSEKFGCFRNTVSGR